MNLLDLLPYIEFKKLTKIPILLIYSKLFDLDIPNVDIQQTSSVLIPSKESLNKFHLTNEFSFFSVHQILVLYTIAFASF